MNKIKYLAWGLLGFDPIKYQSKPLLKLPRKKPNRKNPKTKNTNKIKYLRILYYTPISTLWNNT